MDSELDLFQGIHRLMTKIKEQLENDWVQSHQDDDIDVDITTLSVGIQLNIKADTLVTQGLDKLDSKQKVPLDPPLKLMLQ